MLHKKVQKFLDKHYKRVVQRSSANWGGNNVWSVKSDGITEGTFIYQDDDNNFILLNSTEENEETVVEDLFTYVIGSGTIKNLIISK
jgi:hypothetical protein